MLLLLIYQLPNKLQKLSSSDEDTGEVVTEMFHNLFPRPHEYPPIILSNFSIGCMWLRVCINAYVVSLEFDTRTCFLER